MAAKSAQPWRRSRTSFPKVKQQAAGMRRMARIWARLAKGVGFSKGWAPFAPKKPPPLVPSILMATWEAAGPRAITCSAGAPGTGGASQAALMAGTSVCTTPWLTRKSAKTAASGSRT